MGGHIILGYPCIGKTTLGGKYNFIDLDISNMITNPDGVGYQYIKPSGWEEIYINIAISLKKQGYNVFLNARKDIIKYLFSIGETFSLVYPSLTLKKEWIERATKKYEETKLDRDKKELDRMKLYFDNDISILSEYRVAQIEIDSMDYDLKELIDYYIDY